MHSKQSLRTFRGIGEKRAALLEKLELYTVEDVFFFYPRRYEDRRQITPLASIEAEGTYTSIACIENLRSYSTSRRKIRRFVATLRDGDRSASACWFGASWLQRALPVGKQAVLYGKVRFTSGSLEFVNPECEPCISGRERGSWGAVFPVYPSVPGLGAKWMRAFIRDVLRQTLPHTAETLPKAILDKRGLIPFPPAVLGMHWPVSREHWARARKRLAYQECYQYQAQMKAYREKIRAVPPCFTLDSAAVPMKPFLDCLPFSLTSAQRSALDDILADLGRSVRMNRLLQGDVGSGKTVVALAVAYAVLQSGFNVSILAPTSLLASQLFRVASGILEPLKIPCHFIAGKTPEGERAAIRDALQTQGLEGALVVGTHALISEGVFLPRLGLVVIDEQHRFGVAQRSLLADKGVPHILTMSGTPIPRTLNLCLYGGIPLSVLNEKPAGRKPVSTHVRDYSASGAIIEHIQKELENGGQAYWVCPRIESGEEETESTDKPGVVLSVEERYEALRKELPGVPIAYLHGRMLDIEKEKCLTRFLHGKIRLLVATTVVEVGVDVPGATLMVVEGAGRMGLAQLHQLRGRIGRGERPSVCYLLDPLEGEKSRERLRVLETCSDGFRIAQEDLRLRSVGDIEGKRQHGIPEFHLVDLVKDREIMEWALEDLTPALTKTIEVNAVSDYNEPEPVTKTDIEGP